MYNEEQKNRYISYIDSRYSDYYVNNTISLFRKTEPVETLFERDASCFSHEQIANMYSLFSYSDEFIYSSVNSRLQAYCDWCNENNLVPDGCNHYREFRFNDFHNYVDQLLEKKKYITREELNELLKQIVNPRDKFVILGIFEFGKSEHFIDLFEMRLSDIDEKNLTVSLASDRVVRVTRMFVDIAKEADEEEIYHFPTSEKTKRMTPSTYIFKKVKTNNVQSDDDKRYNKMIAQIIKSSMDYCGGYVGINAASLAISGQIERIRKRAEEMGIPKEDYVVYHFDDLRKQYILSPNIPKVYLKKYGAYL